MQCEKTGCAGEICLQHCKYSLDGSLLNSQKEPLYMQLNQRDCPSDCKYHCMVQREKKRSSLGFGPVKYYGKWPLKRVFGLQVCNFMNLGPKFYTLVIIILHNRVTC